ncbi:T4SS effector BepD [Bartonella henselae]|uniref:T4SS effector BepD n=1 Tax=Bartonella henselae TaxID=38323 RepID=UPI001579707E|nr:T4SS effector BepD [Bartonella henselae]UJM33524.1 T4SS effector BepD [Bartonella henselae]UJM34108.1 T4SS effector BepD [Bartonella henselae]GFF01955.1 hypothetical protein BH623125_03890 [Bartonella henselae]GFF04362.1 hypothetical protein BH80429_11830 [Bartonella henselae]
MKKNRPSPPTSRSKEQEQEQARTPSPQAEPLYAQVNKPPREHRAQSSEETIYAPQNPPETIYAPQKPLGNPYDRLGGRPRNGRRAKKLVDPYAVTDVQNLDRGADFQTLENPLYEGVGGGAHGGPHPQEPEHLYAELEFDTQSGRSPQKPVESVYATVGMGAEGGQDTQTLKNPLYEGVGSGKTTPPPTPHSTEKEQEQARAPSPQAEPLYAQVNKPPREHRAQSSEETIYAPQNPPETIYAPQKPLGNPYDRLGGRPRNGRRAKKLVDPYAVTDVQNLDRGADFQTLENPLYEGVGGGAHGGPHPQEPEHLYAELEFDTQGGRSPQKPVESVYATVGMGTEGGQDTQTLKNPLYEGVGPGRATSPPRSPKDEVTSKLLKHTDFQHGVKEVQEWCKIVYGNQYALNKKLCKILENPKAGDTILWDLAADPESAGKLAGQKILGIKSPDRKQAEEGFGSLCAAFERHVAITQKLHKDFTLEQEKQRGHERETSPERQEHRHHRRHHSQEREQGASEQEARRRNNPTNQKGMAFGM